MNKCWHGISSHWGVHRGLNKIRACFRKLQSSLPNAYFTYKFHIVENDLGFLEWSAVSDTNVVADVATRTSFRTAIFAPKRSVTPFFQRLRVLRVSRYPLNPLNPAHPVPS